MEMIAQYNVNPDDFALFLKLLPQKHMFLVDVRPNKDHKVVHRTMNNEILITAIRRHQPSPWKPEFSVFITGDNWGSLNGRLFEGVPALAYAIQKRGLTQVEF
jgi:hypothetical protein